MSSLHVAEGARRADHWCPCVPPVDEESSHHDRDAPVLGPLFIRDLIRHVDRAAFTSLAALTRERTDMYLCCFADISVRKAVLELVPVMAAEDCGSAVFGLG
jgi:hypothetical protein